MSHLNGLKINHDEFFKKIIHTQANRLRVSSMLSDVVLHMFSSCKTLGAVLTSEMENRF